MATAFAGPTRGEVELVFGISVGFRRVAADPEDEGFAFLRGACVAKFAGFPGAAGRVIFG